jgi:hypothetical protein
VNATGQAFSTQYRDVTKAYSNLAAAKSRGSGQADRLDRAAKRLTVLRHRIAAIPAPRQARLLRQRLIAFYRAQETVAYEIADISVYFPALVAVERPLGPASKKMQSAVARQQTPEAQAASLAAYADALGAARRRVQALDAPAVLEKAKKAEVARLARVERSVRAIERALANRDREALRKAVGGLSVDSTPAVAATREGVLAYNRHVREIRTLATQVEQERRELEVTVH